MSDELADALSALSALLPTLPERLAALESAGDELESLAVAERDQVAARAQVLAGLEEEVDQALLELAEEAEGAQAQLEAALASLDRRVDALGELEAEASDLAAAVGSVGAAGDLLGRQLEDAATAVGEGERRLEAAAAGLEAAVEAEQAALQERTEGLAAELAELAEAVAEASEQVEQGAAAFVATAEAVHTQVCAEVDELVRHLEEQGDRHAEAVERVSSELGAGLVPLREELVERLEVELATRVQRGVDDVRAQLGDLTRTLARSGHELEAARSRLEAALEPLDDLLEPAQRAVEEVKRAADKVGMAL